MESPKTTIWLCFFQLPIWTPWFWLQNYSYSSMENWMYFEKSGPSLNKKNLLKNTPASDANPDVKRAHSFICRWKKRLSSSTYPGVQKNPSWHPTGKKNVQAYGMWTLLDMISFRPICYRLIPSAFKSVKFPPKKQDETSQGAGLPKFATFACADDSQLRGFRREGFGDIWRETFGAWNLQGFWEATTRVFLDQHMVA